MYKSRLKEERVAFHNPIRKEARSRLYREIEIILLERNKDVLLEDKMHCLRIVEHKLREQKP